MPLSSDLTQLQTFIDAELRSVVAHRQQPLYGVMEYALGWKDLEGSPLTGPPALRPHATFCLLICQGLGGNVDRALPAAVAVELMSHFSLVHDDVQDANPHRDNRPAVWWNWGPGQAINVGDGLHALARLSLFNLGGRGIPSEGVLEAAQLLDQACLQLCEGQYHDLLFQERVNVSQDAYLSMAENRMGSLWGCAGALGALCASANAEVLVLCRQGGQKLGLALEIQRDLLKLWGDSTQDPAAELLNKKKNLPVIHALETGDAQLKRELGTLYLQRVLDPTNVPRIVEILDAAGSRKYSQELAEQTMEEALGTLKQAGVTTTVLGDLRSLLAEMSLHG